MKTLLVIKASIFGEQGNSSQLVEKYQARWQEKHPNGMVVIRDLAKDPIPHLDANIVMAWMTPEADRTQEQETLSKQSMDLIQELVDADEVVIGMPMYNFGIPSTFKAWIDQIARAGVTFKYTETGPLGLLEAKPISVIAARGGIYQGSDKDTQTKYLQDVFAFIGLSQVSFTYAEALNMGEEHKDAAYKQAEEKISELVA